MKGEFSGESASGIIVYTSGIYSNLCKMRGIDIKKLEYEGISAAYHMPSMLHVSYLLNSLVSDFSGYDIIHNPHALRPFIPMNKGKALLVSTCHDVAPLTTGDLATKTLESDDKSIKEVMRRNLVTANMEMTKFTLIRGFELALKSDYMIANSIQSMDEVLSFGYDKKRISVVNYGIDERFFAASKSKQSSEFKLGYMGSFELKKNLQFAIKAMKYVKDPKIKLELWGTRTIESKLLEKAAGNDKRIIFKGRSSRDEITDIYDSFGAFVFPSLHEGFGLPIIEAQARGVPVILYKEAKISKEIRKHCFEAKDPHHMAQIIEKLKDNGYVAKSRKKAMAYARTFTWKRAAQGTVDAYRRALELN